MTVASAPVPMSPRPPRAAPWRRDIRIGLLGLGDVGSAVAPTCASPPAALGGRVRDRARRWCATPRPPECQDVALTLIRTRSRRRPRRDRRSARRPRAGAHARARSAPAAPAGGHREQVPARASRRRDSGSGRPRRGSPLCYEAGVIAGVPFLGTLARRPLASALTPLTGIVNGTSNFVLSVMDRTGVGLSAQRSTGRSAWGFAEPEPANDIDGIDAVEKLTILLRQFRRAASRPEAIENIWHPERERLADLAHAREFGGTIKPVVHAEHGTQKSHRGVRRRRIRPSRPPAGRLEGAANGVCLRDRSGSRAQLHGARRGPRRTAVTILDDVVEATSGTGGRPGVAGPWGASRRQSPHGSCS